MGLAAPARNAGKHAGKVPNRMERQVPGERPEGRRLKDEKGEDNTL